MKDLSTLVFPKVLQGPSFLLNYHLQADKP